MNYKPIVFLPKFGSRLWPVTEYVFKKFGVEYDPSSRKYRVATSEIEFFLGKPQDWRVELEKDEASVAVTGLDLVIDYICKRKYVASKRAIQIVQALPRDPRNQVKFIRGQFVVNPKKQDVPTYRDIFFSMGNYLRNGPPLLNECDEEEEYELLGTLDSSGKGRKNRFSLNIRPFYTFEDAKNLKGFPSAVTVIKLKVGKGKVVLLGDLPPNEARGGWDTVNIACSTDYQNLAELWLDQNYTGSEIEGYRLVPYNGSAEGTKMPCVIDFCETGDTANANGRKISEVLLDSQAVVLVRRDELASPYENKELRTFAKELFDGILEV